MANLIRSRRIMEDSKNLENIEDKIKKLKMEKTKIKQAQDRKLRLRSNNCGKSNVLTRVAIIVKKTIDNINTKREENGFDCLSGPKVTQLYFSHKKYSPLIERDIINYNTLLDEEEEFNEK